MKDLERIYAEKDFCTYVGSDTRAEVQNVAVLFRSSNCKNNCKKGGANETVRPLHENAEQTVDC